MYDKTHCSPISQKVSDTKYSCLNKKLLNKIARILDIKFNESIKILHNDISNRIRELSDCKKEQCWISIDKIITKLNDKEYIEFKDMFKPIMPKTWYKNNKEWLNTFDIENVLKQYDKNDKTFYFYGAMPSDYYNKSVCDIYKLCKIDIDKHINNGIKKIGIVFNTDESNQPGKHWVAIYIDLTGINSGFPSIYFFDSVGNQPQDNIKKFINKLRTKKKFNYYYNDIIHQKKNTECGIYCLHFLTYMINKGNFKKYIKKIKSDDYIHKYRNFFFNKI